jgi:hypothetical protein
MGIKNEEFYVSFEIKKGAKKVYLGKVWADKFCTLYKKLENKILYIIIFMLITYFLNEDNISVIFFVLVLILSFFTQICC